MMTVEIKVNGKRVATATLVNQTCLTPVSDYRLDWTEAASDVTGGPERRGEAFIRGHARRQTVWALVGKAVIAILGQMGDRAERQ